MPPSLTGEGKPHIFLLDDPAREKERVTHYARHHDAYREYAEIIDVMYEVLDRRELSAQHLTVLKKAMESRFKVVWGAAGRRLIQLSHYFHQAEVALCELQRHKNAKVRLRLIQSLWQDRPTENMTKALLKSGLHDRSKHVRYFSLERIRLFKYVDFIPELEVLAKTETQHEVFATIDETIHLLRDGYSLMHNVQENDYILTVATLKGLRMTMISQEKMSDGEVKEKIRQLIEQPKDR